MDKEIIEGIGLWLAARKLEALHINDRQHYTSIALLQNDVIFAEKHGLYPWELITKGFNDKARGKVS